MTWQLLQEYLGFQLLLLREEKFYNLSGKQAFQIYRVLVMQYSEECLNRKFWALFKPNQMFSKAWTVCKEKFKKDDDIS